MVRITRAFTRFSKQPFEEKHNLLRTAFKEIILENGTIPAFTLNGTFFDDPNLLARSSSSLQIISVPDLTIALPEPMLIPFVDRRRKSA